MSIAKVASRGYSQGILWFALLWLALTCAFRLSAQTTPTFAVPVPVEITSPPIAIVTLTTQTGGTITSISVLTGGAPNLDFQMGSGGTCATGNAMSAGQSCTVSVSFKPMYPGLRFGAVQLMTDTGLLASTPLTGIGQGSLPVLLPGEINVQAGDGNLLYSGDGVSAASTSVYLPIGLAVDASGDLFICDTGNNRIREVFGPNGGPNGLAKGDIITVAGNGSSGFLGDGNAATAAELNSPTSVVVDGAGNLYIADTGNSVIRRVDAVTNTITTVAGRAGASGFSGDGGPALSAQLDAPEGLALTSNGNLLIADSGNSEVRLLDLSSLLISSFAGTGVAGYSGDGNLATQAQLNQPYGIAVNANGTAIADTQNQCIRYVDAKGNISTIAGNGKRGPATDNVAATQSSLNEPVGVALDPAGDVFIADSENNRVRVVWALTGNVQTVVGNGNEGYAGDPGPSNAAVLYKPYAVVFDAGGNLWISDRLNNRVREVQGAELDISYPQMKVSTVSAPSFGSLYNLGDSALVLNAPAFNQAQLDAGTSTCYTKKTTVAVGDLCAMGVDFAPTQVGGDVTGSVTWSSNAPNVTPVDKLSGQVLSKQPTTVALTSSANPGQISSAITFTAQVTSKNTTFTGTVTFTETESNYNWCSNVTVQSAGPGVVTASCTVPSLSLGQHTFVAAYSGDGDDAAETSDPLAEVIKEKANLVLSASSNPAVVTSNVSLKLIAQDQSGTPTGTVTLFDGATAVSQPTALDGTGTAYFTLSNLALGTHPLFAQYTGDTADAPGTSNTISLQITKADSTTHLTSTNGSPTVGQATQLTAAVISGGGPTPTGTVQFTDGTGPSATVLATGALDAQGMVSAALPSLPPGMHTIFAIYSGDADTNGSTSPGVQENIQQIATSTLLSSDVNPANAGTAVHLTAIVAASTPSDAQGTLTGIVTFTDGSTVLGSAPVNSTGQVILTANGLAVGTHSIVASYGGSTNYASSSFLLKVVVQTTPTQTLLSTSSATTLAGKPADLTAVVTSSTGTPTGSIVFRDGTVVLGAVPINGVGSASLQLSSLAVGAHSLTATYGGDANYQVSISTPLTQTIVLASPALQLSGPTNALDAGLNTQFSAVLTSPGVPPTGSLNLLDGGTVIGSVKVTADGPFTFNTSQLSLGTHSLSATYGGDVDNATAVSAAVTVVIKQASTTTALNSSANPLTKGAPLSVTATVTADSPNISGSVTLRDGDVALGTVPLMPNGTALFQPAGLALGVHSFTAVYGGDTNHLASTSGVLPELVVMSTTATLSSSANPSPSGSNLTFTAQIAGTSRGISETVPTGAVTFHDGSAVLATVPLNAVGAASFATSNLSVGSHAVTVTYEGDQNFAAASGQLQQVVVEATTALSLQASANPGTYGQPLQLTATSASNGGVPTGTVTFALDGASIAGTAPLNTAGVAVLTTTQLPPGTHTVVARYAGDGEAESALSAPLSVTVKQTTGLTLLVTASPSLTLSPVTLTAVLTNAHAAPATGSIAFSDGSAPLGTAPLDATGHATLTLLQMSAGKHLVSASYAGDGANFSSSTEPYAEIVQLRPTTISVTGSATDTSNPQQMTLIAVVKGDGSVPPGGSVTFTSGSVTLGMASVDETGVADITVIFPTLTMPVVATYSGDPSYASSTSASTEITAGQPEQFTLNVNVPRITLISHQHATVMVTLGSVKGFTDTVALGCLGLPYAATCSFTKPQIGLQADGQVSTTLTVDTGDPLGAGTGTTASAQAHGQKIWLCWSPAALLLLLRRKQQKQLMRRVSMLVLLFLTAAVSVSLSGCSGLKTSGTAPGTYTFKVVGTGQGSGTTQTQTVTLVVTQ